MAQYQATLNLLIAAAEKPSRGLRRDFGEIAHLQVSQKDTYDFASKAVQKIEARLVDALSDAREGYGFLLPQGREIEGADKSHRWIIDPLNGFTNFRHAVAHFAISIALEREGEIVAGLLYNPISDELFQAQKGGGAFSRDHRLRVSARTHIADAMLACSAPSEVLAKQAQTMRLLGAPALDIAFVAAGRLDGFYGRELDPCEMAGALLILREAGGIATDDDYRPKHMESGTLVVANDTLHSAMLKSLKN